jgi:hypothetical protein
MGIYAVHLAWMPLSQEPSDPILQTTQYYTGDPAARWSSDPGDAKALFRRANYTAVSATWFEPLKVWGLLYTRAGFVQDPMSTVAARFSPTPWDLESAPEIEIFNPVRESAFGRYIYRPDGDDLKRFQPPAEAVCPGYPYGAFILPRFTRWHESRNELHLVYLMSTFTPYQVQVMSTVLSVSKI